MTSTTSRRLQAALAAEQARARMPSVVAGLVRDGELVWVGEHGVHTGAHAQAPAADLQYRVGSITKTMTAVLVMQLRDEGRFDLSDRLGDYLADVGYGDRTIRSLLAHSSGMQSEPAGPWWERSPGVDYAELAAGVDDLAAPFAPGATYHYSNLAFGLLGELVARLRGSTWWEQVSKRILAPLGMRRTSYEAEPPSAAGYSVHPYAGTLTDEPAHDTRAMAPAGQLWSSVEDLAAYSRFLVEGDEHVLPLETLLEMATPQSGSLAGGLSGGYGLGFRLLAGGSGTLCGHTGSMPGFLAGLFVDRPRRTAAVCLANGTSGLRCEGLPVDLLEQLERHEPTVVPPWRPVQRVPSTVSDILGMWYWGNTSYAFTYDGVQVSAAPIAAGAATLTFRPRDDDSFVGTSGYHHGETLRVARDDTGRATHLVCATFVYTRTPYDPSAPVPGADPGSPDQGK